MESIMELLIKKSHPDYTHDDIWKEVWDFCNENELKIRLFLKWYHYESVSESFDKLRKQVMLLICDSSDREVQRMLRGISNFETGMLVLMADETAKEQLRNNLSRRLERYIDAEAYVIAKKLAPDEKMFEKILRRVMSIFFSEEMLQLKRELWERSHGFQIEPNLSRDQKICILYSKCPMERVVRWNKLYEPVRAKVCTYLFHDFEINQCRDIIHFLEEREYKKGLEAAYSYSASGKGNVSFLISGLELDEREEICYSSYIVRQKKDKKVIYRVVHELELFPNVDEEPIEGDLFMEVTEEVFFKFCRLLYGRQYD